jgi:pilus assembly protein CpaB
MNPARIAIVLVAGVAAVALALIVRNMAIKPGMGLQAHGASELAPPMTRVLVAKADLVPGDRLTVDNITWQAWPVSSANAAFVTDGQPASAQAAGPMGAVTQAKTAVNDMATGGGPKLQALVGSIVRDPIFAGEPITAKKIVRGGDSGYLAVRLPAGTRAMSLPLTVESGAGGFIQPGDRVDVLSTHPDPTKSGSMVTDVILGDAKVLAIDQHTDTPKTGASQVGASITLEVPVGSMDAVARARSQGTLAMALRSYADIGATARPAAPPDQLGVRLIKGGGPVELVTAQ